MNPKISIIILNWNGWEDTIECLESLYRIDYLNYEVILVDNFSTDDSIQKIKNWSEGKIQVKSKYFETTRCTHDLKICEYTKQELDSGLYIKKKRKIDNLPANKKLFLLRNDENYGFAGGNNIAIKQVLSELVSTYVLLINNDTTVKKDFLSWLVSDIKKDISLGMIAPVSYSYYSGGIDFFGGDINWYIGRSFHIKKETDHEYYQFLTGACLLISLEAIKKVGLFNEKYFCYFEDSDLSQRFIKQGFQLGVSKTSGIFHKISASSGYQSPFFIYHFARNRIWFNKTHNSGYKKLIFYIWQFIIKSIGSYFFFDVSQRKMWFQGIKDGIRK